MGKVRQSIVGVARIRVGLGGREVAEGCGVSDGCGVLVGSRVKVGGVVCVAVSVKVSVMDGEPIGVTDQVAVGSGVGDNKGVCYRVNMGITAICGSSSSSPRKRLTSIHIPAAVRTNAIRTARV